MVPPISQNSSLPFGCNSSSSNHSNEHQKYFLINSEKLKAVLNLLTPITLPCHDKEGRVIQLWRYRNDFIGAVRDEKNQINIISSGQIYNPLQSHELNTAFLSGIEELGLRKWSLVYQPDKKRISVWPYLIAAGKDDAPWIPPIIPKNPSIENHIFRKKGGHLLGDTPENRERLLQVTSTRDNYVGTDKHANDIYLKKNPDGTQSWAEVREGEIRNGGVNTKYAPSRFNPTSQALVRFPKRGKDLSFDLRRNPSGLGLGPLHRQALAVDKVWQSHYRSPDGQPPGGGKPPQGSGGGAGGGLDAWSTAFLGGFNKKSFLETVQQNRLTDSYNAGNPNKPIPEKGASGGSIGGIGNEVGIIKGLFDTVNGLKEDRHYFHVPSIDGKMPFSNEALQQILRELAVGIYVHDTVPFFSLHFNSDSNMYPVIHPAYQNTLVGRVISLLDYYMKGFLNGAFFEEAFIKEWQKNPTQDTSALKPHCINLHEYCKEHLGDEHTYFSIKERIEMLEKASRVTELADLLDIFESGILSDYSGFRSSFRIIAKQNSIKKADNLFALDGGFDVLYTIEPDPVYEDELKKYRAHYGRDPAGYKRLVLAYDEMSKQIETIMPRLPIFQELFEQLKVINFFSYYFKTLKQAQKVPLLEPKPLNSSFACQPLFPHLPILKMQKEEVKLDFGKVFEGLSPEGLDRLEKYLEEMSKEENQLRGAELLEKAADIVEPSFKRVLQAAISFRLPNDTRSVGRHRKFITNYLKALPKRAQEMLGKVPQELSKLRTTQAAIQKAISDLHEQLSVNRDGKIERAIQQRLTVLRERLVELEEELHEYKRRITEPYREGLIGLIGNPIIFCLYIHALHYAPTAEASVQEIKNAINACNEVVAHVQGLRAGLTAVENEIHQHENAHLNPAKFFYQRTTASFEEPSSVIQFYSEQPLEERDQHRRTIGGCGLKLQSQPITVDPLAISTLNLSFPDLFDSDGIMMKPVKAAPLKRVEGYTFKLHFSDFNASKDKEYGWMSHILTEDEQEKLELQAQLFSFVQQNDKEVSKNVLISLKGDFNSTDTLGVSLVHHAAQAKSSYALEELIALKAHVSSQDTNGFIPLHYAVMAGLLENVKILLRAAPETLNQVTKNNATALYLAVQHNQPGVVKFLLSMRPNATLATHYGMTPLYCALHHGFEKIALELIASTNEQVNIGIEDGTSPLYLAVELGMIAVVDALLKNGAIADKPRKDSYTPLHIAAKSGSKDMCQLLLQQPVVDVNVKLRSGKTPLHLAVVYNEPDVVDLLLTKGADPMCHGWDNETALLAAIRIGNSPAALSIIAHYVRSSSLRGGLVSLFDFSDRNGVTPLNAAFTAKQLAVVQKLLEQGVSTGTPESFLNRLCEAKVSPPYIEEFIKKHSFNAEQLNKAYYHAAKHGHNQMVSIFKLFHKVEEPQFFELLAPHCDNGWSIVHFAAQYDHINVIKAFIKSNPDDLLQLTKHRLSIAAIAAIHGSKRSLKLILDAMVKKDIPFSGQYRKKHLLLAAIESGDPDIVDAVASKMRNRNEPLDKDGKNGGHYAALRGDVEVLDLLRRRSISCENADLAKKNVTHYAFEYRQKDVVEYILNPKHEIVLRKNLLHFAAAKSSSELVQKLIQAGSNVHEIISTTNKTPLFCAIEFGNYKTFIALCEAGACIDARAHAGYTPLLIAAKCGRLNMLAYLLSRTSPDQTNDDGQNALHLAAYFGHEECVEYLLNQGFSPIFADKKKKTALDCAKKMGHTNIVMLLEGKGKELKNSKKLLVAALKRGDIKDFFGQIQGLPLNKSMTFEIDEKKVALPLLHLIHLLVRDSDLRALTLKEYMGLDGVDKFARCPEKTTVFHSMARAEEDINFDEVDPLLADERGITLLHLCAGSRSAEKSGQFKKALEKCKSANKSIDVEEKSGLTPIYAAISNGRLENIQSLLEAGANPNHISRDKVSPLVLAIESNHLPIVTLLLEHGALINLPCLNNKETALHRAIEQGFLDVARFLIDQGADVNKPNRDGVCPLHLAAKNGHLPLMRQLVFAQASLTAADHEGKTVAHYAAESKNPKIFDYLSSCNISLEQQTENVVHSIRKLYPPTQGKTPLHSAVERGNLQMVKKLQEKGCDLGVVAGRQLGTLFFAAKSGSKSTLEFLKDHPPFQELSQQVSAIIGAIAIDSVRQLKTLFPPHTTVNLLLDSQGTRALHYAALYGSMKSFHYLVQRGADLKVADFEGRTPLERAVETNRLALVRYIAQATDAIDITKTTVTGQSYLYRACEDENVEMAALLIELGVSINERDLFGLTPLELAVKKSNYSLLQLLLALGAELDEKIVEKQAPGPIKKLLEEYLQARKKAAERGESLLHTAVRLNDLKHLPFLMRGGDIDSQDKEGMTALHLACLQKNLTLIRMLLERGAALEFTDNKGRTPLYLAATQVKNLEVVRFLLRAKAEPATENFDGESLLVASSKCEDAEYARQLTELLANYLPPKEIKEPFNGLLLSLNSFEYGDA